MPISGWHLFAPGIDIKLGDGGSYTLKFNMKAVLVAEEQYGGLTAFMEEIRASGFGPKELSRFIDAMLIPLQPKLTRDELIEKMVFKDYTRYVEALTEAFDQAIPDSDEEKADPNASGSADGSHGNSSTTSPPSDMVAATSSSGV